MPALNFTVFREKILDGTKLQTIRRKRKHDICVGDRLYLYWGQRTSNCEKLAESTCIKLQDFAINIEGVFFVDGTPLNSAQSEELAISDGFCNSEELRNFFVSKYGLPVDQMVIIYWGGFLL